MARANERNMQAQHVGHNMLRSFIHHVVLYMLYMLAYVTFSLKPENFLPNACHISFVLVIDEAYHNMLCSFARLR